MGSMKPFKIELFMPKKRARCKFSAVYTPVVTLSSLNFSIWPE